MIVRISERSVYIHRFSCFGEGLSKPSLQSGEQSRVAHALPARRSLRSGQLAAMLSALKRNFSTPVSASALGRGGVLDFFGCGDGVETELRCCSCDRPAIAARVQSWLFIMLKNLVFLPRSTACVCWRTHQPGGLDGHHSPAPTTERRLAELQVRV